MISLSREYGRVYMNMSVEDYSLLLLLTGITLGHLKQHDEELFWPFLEMVNEMNAGNPQYQPYEIPPEHRGKRQLLAASLHRAGGAKP